MSTTPVIQDQRQQRKKELMNLRSRDRYDGCETWLFVICYLTVVLVHDALYDKHLIYPGGYLRL